MISRIYEVKEAKVTSSAKLHQFAPAIEVVVKGTVNSGGWSNPQLGPWIYIVPPVDGVLDLDFYATAPAPGVIVTEGFQDISATLTLPVPDWVVGVRVHSSTNIIDARLAASSSGRVMRPMDGLPVPWPFPWFRPAPAAAGA